MRPLKVLVLDVELSLMFWNELSKDCTFFIYKGLGFRNVKVSLIYSDKSTPNSEFLFLDPELV